MEVLIRDYTIDFNVKLESRSIPFFSFKLL